MQRLGEFFARLVERLLPDPLVLAALLTLLVFGVGLALPQAPALADQPIGARSVALSRLWLDAVWNPAFLTFALQMCVVLLTGYGLARAPLATRGLRWLAGLASSNRRAVYLIALTSCVGCWINWGFGLVLAGLLAAEIRRELARRSVHCQYALIVAAAYAGMMIWHGGFSGSAPLKIASDGVDIELRGDAGPVTEHLEPIAINQTILSIPNLVLTGLLFAGVPMLLAGMARNEGSYSSEATPSDDKPESTRTNMTSGIANRLNTSRVPSALLAVLVFAALLAQWTDLGLASVGLNFVNSTFLALGLLLHRSLASYAEALAEGGRAIVGIVVQFPLYSGIQGVMFGAGLAAAISNGFVNASTSIAEWLHIGPAQTFPIATLASAGVVNFFVPSGGGQWIVQGPIMCAAARSLGTDIGQTVMAVAYGDQLTNMVQPFWAIPLMGLTGVNARQFLGYCALLMLLATPIFVMALLFY